MRETSVPAGYEVAADENLTDLVVSRAERSPGLELLRRPVGDDPWVPVSAREFLGQVTAVAKGLAQAGVAPGDRVALLSRTRYEWTLIDFAVWFAGAVVVPVYETSSKEQVRWILSDSGAVAVVVETALHATIVESVKPDLVDLRHVFVIDEGAVEELTAAGGAVADDEIEARRRTHRADSTATIVYTSGTTGRPKGCELSHGNFISLARGAADVFPDLVNERATTLLFLPLAHVFARFIEVLCLETGATLAHTPSVADLLGDLAAVQPTFLLAVPRVFEKIYNSAEAQARSGGRGGVFEEAARTAIAWSRAQDDGGPGLVLRLKHAVFDRLVYARLRAATGGKLQGAVSGGAPLGERLGHFFRGIGIPVLEGWGLTETTAPATVNTLQRNKVGTVGLPLPGVSIRLGDDDELLVKGVGVMRGYHHNDEASAEALQDGWFRSGDLGSIDADGYVRITGRKKEIIVTAGGKNVVPAVLEDQLRAHPLISQAMVVGDQRPFVGCLITLDDEMLPTWLKNHAMPVMTVAEAARDEGVRAELQKAVDLANEQVSKAEGIKKFIVLDTDFTEESGHLTPKLSLKRAVVMKDFAGPVEELYTK